jgi:hypothetical protein
MLALLESQRARAIRKVEIGSRTREESEKVQFLRHAEKEVAKADQLFRRSLEEKEISASLRSRMDRWKLRLLDSPLKANLVEHDIRRSRLQAKEEERRKRSASAKSDLDRKLTSIVMGDSLDNSPLEMTRLRRAKRELLFQAKYLRAMRDVERSALLCI